MKINKNTATEHRNRFFLMVLPAILLSVAMVHADETQAPEDISTSLQVVSVNPLPGDETVYLMPEDTTETQKQLQIKVSSTSIPKPVDYKGGRKIILSTRQEDKDYQAAASVELPESCKQTIIVLFPAPEDAKLPYVAMAVDGSLSSFKAGTRLIVNMSTHVLRGEIGRQPFTRGDSDNLTFECDPGKSVNVPVLDPNAKALASQPVILEYKEKEEDKTWKVLSSSRWFHTPDQRHLILVYDNEKSKAMSLRGLTDMVIR